MNGRTPPRPAPYKVSGAARREGLARVHSSLFVPPTSPRFYQSERRAGPPAGAGLCLWRAPGPMGEREGEGRANGRAGGGARRGGRLWPGPATCSRSRHRRARGHGAAPGRVESRPRRSLHVPLSREDRAPPCPPRAAPHGWGCGRDTPLPTRPGNPGPWGGLPPRWAVALPMATPGARCPGHPPQHPAAPRRGGRPCGVDAGPRVLAPPRHLPGPGNPRGALVRRGPSPGRVPQGSVLGARLGSKAQLPAAPTLCSRAWTLGTGTYGLVPIRVLGAGCAEHPPHAGEQGAATAAAVPDGNILRGPEKAARKFQPVPGFCPGTASPSLAMRNFLLPNRPQRQAGHVPVP